MSRRRGGAGRGVPGEEQPPVPVGEALAQISSELGLADPGALGAITSRWDDVVGAAIAGHSRVRSLRGSTLTVGVESGTWATELRYLERDVLERIEALVGAGVVSDLRVAVDPPEPRDERA